MRETANLGNPTGSVGPGDVVICTGEYATVTRVVTAPPGHGDTLVRNDLTLVKVITTAGSRYLGAERTWIGSDLRMHWER